PSSLLLTFRPPPSSTLFPYTTLFRSIVLEPDRPVRMHDVDHPQPAALADLEIVEIMRRSDLDRAGPRLRVGIIVGDDGNTTPGEDRKSTRLNSSHVKNSYAVFCLKKK